MEVGSRQVGKTVSFRDEYPNYLGVDIQAGEGVDVVADLSKSHIGTFDLVICCSVLEHVQDPWSLANGITKHLKPGGRLYVAVPWTWRFHAYPDDYWRFSWRGIETLFPEILWEKPMYSTTREGEFFPAEFQSDNNLATVIEGRKFIPYLMLHMIGTWKP